VGDLHGFAGAGPVRERNAGMAYHDIILEKQDGIAGNALNRAEALNAFREPMHAELGLAKTIMYRSAELNFYAFLENEALATTIGTKPEDPKRAHALLSRSAPPNSKVTHATDRPF
jgi:hypothetical protein